MKDRAEHIITPPKKRLSVDWAELWRYRGLFVALAWRDISVRYKQTVLGLAWVGLQPLLTMVVFTFIFNRMAKIESGDGTPYPIFVFVGLIFWQYYSSTLNNASSSMVSNANMFQKNYFPRIIIPAAAAAAGLVDFAVSFVILAGMLLYYGFWIKITGLLVLPFLVICMALSAAGLGLFLAALNVKYRDVRYALPFLIQTLMYVTPIIYPIRMLDGYPAIKTMMLWLNPMSGVITGARAAMLGTGSMDWKMLAISAAASAIIFVLGLRYFTGAEQYFADIV